MASKRAALRAACPQRALSGVEKTAIATRVLPTLYRAETAQTELQAKLEEVRKMAPCFASLKQLDASRNAIVRLIRIKWESKNLAKQALRELASNAFKRMRTALFPGASKKPMQRAAFGPAVLGVLDARSATGDAAQARLASRLQRAAAKQQQEQQQFAPAACPRVCARAG